MSLAALAAACAHPEGKLEHVKAAWRASVRGFAEGGAGAGLASVQGAAYAANCLELGWSLLGFPFDAAPHSNASTASRIYSYASSPPFLLGRSWCRWWRG